MNDMSSFDHDEDDLEDEFEENDEDDEDDEDEKMPEDERGNCPDCGGSGLDPHTGGQCDNDDCGGSGDIGGW